MQRHHTSTTFDYFHQAGLGDQIWSKTSSGPRPVLVFYSELPDWSRGKDCFVTSERSDDVMTSQSLSNLSRLESQKRKDQFWSFNMKIRPVLVLDQFWSETNSGLRPVLVSEPNLSKLTGVQRMKKRKREEALGIT